ncbi:hypothetical protein Q7A53_08060 [Halobacillus rhizosphaerae]|uniref:hypothetical protein n=1 Tax=Halobacillus rhizosphaerae TaxID=3064889 RepID=UPI00398B20D9
MKTIQADAAEIREVAGAFSVFTAPVVLVFAEGKEWFRRARFVPMGELQQELTKLNHLLNE